MTAQSLQSISGEGVTLFSAGEQKNGDASQPDRRRLQERRLPAPKSLVFASVMNVLADNGFRATFADATTGFITAIGSVRRQNIWRISRRKLAECGPRLGVDVRRQACGAASADVRWSVA